MQVKLHNGETVECEKVAKMAWDGGAGAEVDRRTRKVMRESGRGYSDAMKCVLAIDPHLKSCYASEPVRANGIGELLDELRASIGAPRENLPPTSAPPPSSRTPGYQVHERVCDRRRANPNESYASAMHKILNADPALKAAFARCAA